MSSYLKSHCANQNILRSIYFTIFDSCLNYADLIRAQNYNATQQVIIVNTSFLKAGLSSAIIFTTIVQLLLWKAFFLKNLSGLIILENE